jgi:hypothetical protein
MDLTFSENDIFYQKLCRPFNNQSPKGASVVHDIPVAPWYWIKHDLMNNNIKPQYDFKQQLDHNIVLVNRKNL